MNKNGRPTRADANQDVANFFRQLLDEFDAGKIEFEFFNLNSASIKGTHQGIEVHTPTGQQYLFCIWRKTVKVEP